MGLKGALGKFFRKYFFNPKWRCLLCGREVFEGENFCEKCYAKLPFNDGAICEHCGRKVIAFEPYCTTCKNVLISLDLCRSVFSYEKPISALIQKFKYGNGRYLADYFSECVANLYLKNYLNADGLLYVPMFEKDERKRGYNQSKLLAEKVSLKVNVPLIDCLKKIKETKRQATLSRLERLKNLDGAFRVTDKKSVKDKTLVLIDDVTTTGATAEVIASRLKKAGAKIVYLLTVASTPPIDKY